MPPSEMDGIRSWKFTVSGVGTLELTDTDFWLDYAARAQGTGEAELQVALQSVWQHSDWSTAQGLGRRVFMEDRFKELKWDYVGKKGTLVIDEGTAYEKTLSDITLIDIVTIQGELNDLIEYTPVFSYPLSSTSGTGGLEIARKLQFLPFPHNLLADSDALDQWTTIGTPVITADQEADPEGNTTMDDVEDDDAASHEGVSRSVTFDGELYTFEASFYIKKVTTPTYYPGFSFFMGGSTTQEAQYTIDHENGAVLERDTSPDSALYVKVVDAYTNLWRVVVRLKNADALNDTLRLELYPSVASTFSATWAVATVGTQRYWRAHIGVADEGRAHGAPTEATGSAPGTIDDQSIVLDAENFVIERTREDNAQFKDVFRASKIRIEGSLGLEQLTIRAIKELTVGASNLEKRQDAEDKIETWLAETGKDGILMIDKDDANEKVLTAHLNSTLPGETDLPDAVTYDLNFITRYVA